MKKLRFFLMVMMAQVLLSCDTQEPRENSAVVEAPVSKITEETVFANDLSAIPSKKGIVGLYNVPEMLCMSVTDSASAEEAAAKVEASYTGLEEDLQHTSAIRNGPFGQITYNNDTTNFKFESIALIERVPEKEPVKSKVVVLEADQMLIYNYFGPYQRLYTAYAELGGFVADNNLEQSGPLREFYITDPRTGADPENWRTMLMLPVRKSK